MIIFIHYKNHFVQFYHLSLDQNIVMFKKSTLWNIISYHFYQKLHAWLQLSVKVVNGKGGGIRFHYRQISLDCMNIKRNYYTCNAQKKCTNVTRLFNVDYMDANLKYLIQWGIIIAVVCKSQQQIYAYNRI